MKEIKLICFWEHVIVLAPLYCAAEAFFFNSTNLKFEELKVRFFIIEVKFAVAVKFPLSWHWSRCYIPLCARSFYSFWAFLSYCMIIELFDY